MDGIDGDAGKRQPFGADLLECVGSVGDRGEESFALKSSEEDNVGETREGRRSSSGRDLEFTSVSICAEDEFLEIRKSSKKRVESFGGKVGDS